MAIASVCLLRLWCTFCIDSDLQAVLHQLATHTIPLSFFATHYGSLTDDHAYHPNIRNMYMSTLVDDEKHEVGIFNQNFLVFLTLYVLSSLYSSTNSSTASLNLHSAPMSPIWPVYHFQWLNVPIPSRKISLKSSRRNCKSNKNNMHQRKFLWWRKQTSPISINSGQVQLTFLTIRSGAKKLSGG